MPGNIHDRIAFETTGSPLNTAPPAADAAGSAGSASSAAPLPPASPAPSLSTPRLLDALGLGPAVLDGRGWLDLEAMAGPALRQTDAAAVQQRRALAALGSLQPFLRDVPAAAAAGGSPSGGPDTAAGVQRDRQAAAALAAQCQQQLDGMPTSIAHDTALLMACGGGDQGREQGGTCGDSVQHLGPRVWQAVAARLERKRLLACCRDALQRYLR